MSAIVGPIAPYSNVPIEPQNYNPSQFYISNIALGIQTAITTTVNNNYVVGQLIRLNIPFGYGCRKLNQVEGYVISLLSSSQVLTNIDSSSNVDPFVSGTLFLKPQIVAVGDINSGALNMTPSKETAFIPGSFINVSI